MQRLPSRRFVQQRLLILYFYILYSNSAWFFQDDFGFLVYYKNNIDLTQSYSLENFGRFFSRNVYWYLGERLFSPNANFFYVFNFIIIISTSYLIFDIFRKENGLFFSLSLANIYFIFPGTIYSYSWISNSQHLLGHFFVFLFIKIYRSKIFKNDSYLSLIVLFFVFVFGLWSNFFVCMVLTIVIFDLIFKKNFIEKKLTLVLIFACSLISIYFFFKLSKVGSGAYSTNISVSSFLLNADFYWKNRFFSIAWITSVILGVAITFFYKKFFILWMFTASVLFFLPFAFLMIKGIFIMPFFHICFSYLHSFRY